jgi:membrane protease YdiL (CAAX protease family)
MAFGKFALFAVVFYGVLWLIGRATASVRFTGLGWQALAGNVYVAGAALFATALLAKIQGEPFLRFGLGGAAQASYFVRGIAAGFSLLTALLLVLRLVSGFRFGMVTSSSSALLQYGVLYAALFLAVALAEESLWRGYALVNLSRSISFWPAAILLSVIFGVTHLNHASENFLGIVFASVFGIVLAWSFRRFGSLWFALGAHAGWDYAQSYVYGVPDSGVVLPGSLLHPKISGPDWLTGGHAGPEGSIFMVLIFALLAYCIRLQRIAVADSA